jgi:hypothetical protein
VVAAAATWRAVTALASPKPAQLPALMLAQVEHAAAPDQARRSHAGAGAR